MLRKNRHWLGNAILLGASLWAVIILILWWGTC